MKNELNAEPKKKRLHHSISQTFDEKWQLFVFCMRKSLYSNSFFHFIICSSHLKCLHTAIESCYSNICSMLRMNLVFFMIVFVENALEIVFSATDLLLFLLLWLKWVVAAWLPIGNLLAKNLSNCESNHIIYIRCAVEMDSIRSKHYDMLKMMYRPPKTELRAHIDWLMCW